MKQMLFYIITKKVEMLFSLILNSLVFTQKLKCIDYKKKNYIKRAYQLFQLLTDVNFKIYTRYFLYGKLTTLIEIIILNQ